MFKLSEYNKLDYGYCGTGHSSQGLSKHHAFTYLDPAMINKQAGYVLASRSKQETKLYMSAADTEGFSDALSQMGQALSKDGSSDWTLDYLTKEQRADFTTKFMDKKLEPVAQAEAITAKPGTQQQPAESIKVQPSSTDRQSTAAGSYDEASSTTHEDVIAGRFSESSPYLQLTAIGVFGYFISHFT